MRYLTTMDAEATPNGIGQGTSEEWNFLVLRALAMLGGMVALFLVPLRPEHQPHLEPLALAFVAYKALLFLAIWRWPRILRLLLTGSIGVDLTFVALFVWFSGGAESHFYLLFYLLVALVAAHFDVAIGLSTAAGAGLVYALASLVDSPSADWHHVSARVATFFLLAGALGYLSRRERIARTRAERLNEELREHRVRLEKAYAELQAAQVRLVESERLAAIGQMSAKVSHEVRNPLSSISLNAEMLEDELQALPEDRRGEALGLMAAIRTQLDVLGAVTEEYLRFARLPKPKPERASVARLVEDLADFVRPELTARGVKLKVSLPNGLPTALLDSGQIRQVLLNLIRNAAEAMPDGGPIAVSARRLRDPAHELPRIEIAVQDAGSGIPPDLAGRIFEPFFTTKTRGTGLGLAIARQIVADHGGTLLWEPAPGGGTIFRVILPPAAGNGTP
jgi:signal transduction histidine kinase